MVGLLKSDLDLESSLQTMQLLVQAKHLILQLVQLVEWLNMPAVGAC